MWEQLQINQQLKNYHDYRKKKATKISKITLIFAHQMYIFISYGYFIYFEDAW